MKVKVEIPTTGLEVWYAALDLAWTRGLTFTVAAFCAAAGLKDNRHTRRHLKAMVKAGKLIAVKSLGDDGHYRMHYSAQRTARAW
jgi:hypothetical protein